MTPEEVAEIIYDALNDVDVDALVTLVHQREMADSLAAALDRRGYTVTVKDGAAG